MPIENSIKLLQNQPVLDRIDYICKSFKKGVKNKGYQILL